MGYEWEKPDLYKPMYAWLSFRFTPLETEDVFLVRAWRPFLEQYIWPRNGARAFFVRFADENGPHLRLRLRAEENYIDETLRPSFETWMKERGQWVENTYEPETGRFGGPEVLALAEEHFHLSTRVVLERLSRPYTYADALFDGMRLHALTIQAMGMDRPRIAWYFEQLARQWLPLFIQPNPDKPEKDWEKAVLREFEDSFLPQERELREAIHKQWEATENNRFDHTQPEWLRWYRGNQMITEALGKNLEQALPSLIHLTNNRLGIQNHDEVYLNYLLSRIF